MAESQTELLFLRTKVKIEDLPDSQRFPPQYKYTVTGAMLRVPTKKPCLGKVIELNGERISMFRYEDYVFAVQELCPHAGGELALGDIEELDGLLCVTCPRHHFMFNIQTGRGVAPKTYELKTYPVQLDDDGEISIGFASLSAEWFSEPDF